MNYNTGLIISVCLAISGCLTGSENTGDLKFPEGIFSEQNTDDEFYRQITTDVLTQLNEQRIDGEKETIFRLSVFPANLNKYIIRLRLNQIDSSIQLTYKRLGFESGPEPKMDIELEKKINVLEYPDVYSQLDSLLDDIDFWRLDNKWQCDGADGSIYVLEGVRNGRYHLVCRWSPEHCKFRKWSEFLVLVNYIIGLKSIS